MENFEKFSREGQQRESLEWVMEKIAPLIEPNEVVEYIAAGGSLVKGLKPDAIIITSNRYLIIKAEVLQTFRIQSTFSIVSFDKGSVESCQLKIANKVIAEIFLLLKSGISSGKINIPVNQAIQVYKLINNKDFEGIPKTKNFREQQQIPPKYKKFVYLAVFIVTIVVVGLNTCMKGKEKSNQLSEKAKIERSSSGSMTYDADGNEISQKTSTVAGMELRQLGRFDIGQIRYYFFAKAFNQKKSDCWKALDKKSESIVSSEPVGSCVIIEFLDTETPLMDNDQPGMLSEKSIPHVILQYAKYTNGNVNSQDDPYGIGNFKRKK